MKTNQIFYQHNTKKLNEKEVEFVFSSFREKLEEMGFPIPAVGLIAEENNSPYRVLVATIISLRTQDKVTYDASKRLLEEAEDITKLCSLSEERIRDLIKPSAFYLRKAGQLKEIAKIIVSRYNGKIPSTKEELLSLPGVGTKTANLVLNLSYNEPFICVDCHVHEITHRLGWSEEKSPEETEKALEKTLPVKYWIEINELFVRYGQAVCTPISPKCSICPMDKNCRKIGVEKSR